MAGVTALFLDDDGTSFVHSLRPSLPHWATAAAGASSAARLRQACSSSLNEGPTCPGTARRATSTAIMGAAPFRNETIRTSKTYKKACSSSAILVMLVAIAPTNPLHNQIPK